MVAGQLSGAAVSSRSYFSRVGGPGRWSGGGRASVASAPEDPDTADEDGELSGRADTAERLDDEVQWIRQCPDWCGRFARRA